MALRRPTRLGETILEVSPEARGMRRAQRVADVALPLSRQAMKGRRRSSPLGGNRLLPVMPEVIPADTVIALARQLEDKQPIFDKFTNRYKVKPDRSNIEAYVNGGVKKAAPVPNPDQTELIMDYYADRRRQALHVGDLLQREAFSNRNVARLRRYSLMTTRFLIDRGRELDPDAAVQATDALIDFGHTLNANTEAILHPLHDEDLGYKIIVIGAVATYDPTLLTANPDLLKLVQLEQKARETNWGDLYDATVDVMGDRLTKLNHSDEVGLQTELERLALLRQD